MIKIQKNSATNIRKLVHNVQDHQQKAAVGTHALLSEVRNLKNIEKKRQKLTNEYIEHQKCDTSLPPLKAQLVLKEDSLPSYSQVTTDEEMPKRPKKSPIAPLYPAFDETIEKGMPISDISESSEPTTMEPLYKSRIDRKYDRFAQQWGFDDKKTKEENIDIIQQKVTALEGRVNEQRFPRDEDKIELGGKTVRNSSYFNHILNANKDKKGVSTEEAII